MRNHFLTTTLVASLCSEAISFAGTFTTDFSDPNQPGFTINGAAPNIQGGELMMTPQTGGTGSFILDDLDGGAAIESFTAKFQLKFGPNSIPPADGLSFCFGPEVNSGSYFGVEGLASALCVEFDTYDNAPPDNIGIDVKVAGVEIATSPMIYSQLVDNQFDDVVIQVNRNGTLNLTFKGLIIYTNLVLPDWAPVNGQFGFGASTGYFQEECDIKNLSVTTTTSGPPVAVTITAQPPAAVTVVEATPLTLSVGFDGSAPFSFQWNLNDTPLPGATSNVLNIPLVPFTDNGAKITCTITNATNAVLSQATLLTVLQDTNPPTIKSVVGSESFRFVTVTFSKPVLKSSAQFLGNYSIQGLNISRAAASNVDPSKVVLTTAPQTVGAAYTLVVNGIPDLTAAGNMIATNSQKTFHAFNYVSGFMAYDIYDNMGFTAGSGSLDQLETSFSTLVPTRTLLFTSADTPAWQYGGGYGSVSQGLIVAPETGSYIFHVASDDQSQLFLSTDATPGHLRTAPICQVTTWSGHLDWAGAGKGAPDTSVGSGNVSAPIQLTQGQSYYFRDFHVEGTGDDGISIGWEVSSAPGTITVIPGTNLMALMNTDVSSLPTITISKSPSGVALTFTGSLVSADLPTGPWNDVPGKSPLVITPTASMKYYRAKQ